MISYNKLLLYGNSIDIEINPEDIVLYNFTLDKIPDVINIAYCDVTDIIDLFNSEKGGYVLQKAINNEVTLNIFPTDSLAITSKEREYLVGHEVLFRRKNINLFQTWYDPTLKFEYYIGCTIHGALESFINHFRDFTFDINTKNTHFLTLNNLHTPARESLFHFYFDLDEENKQKFLCSFRFADIFLDKNLSKILNKYDEIFGKAGGAHYQNTLIEIVSESSDVAITEKSYKPLLAGVPFIHWINPSPGGIHHQIEYLKELGLDTEYFGIDYSHPKNVQEKLVELLSLTPDEIRTKYKDDFEKAHQNKIKFYEFVDDITQKLVNV